MQVIQERFNTLLGHQSSDSTPIKLDAEVAKKLLARAKACPLFLHAYAFLTNLTHGTLTPTDLLDIAYASELQGVSLHVLDGEQNSLSCMSNSDLHNFAAHAKKLGLQLHVEISTTEKSAVDEAIRIALTIGAKNIRVYSRYAGTLSRVLNIIAADLRYLAQQADQHDLHFDFEQHEELKSDEIAKLLADLNHPRIHALFDFGNMINACEKPLDALFKLAPHIRQVHMKGVRVVPEANGFGHCGVLQGSEMDELPSPRMIFELLMLGDTEQQVIAFMLEQENHYVAPAFRQLGEEKDPYIFYREMSETPLPDGVTLEQMLRDEPRWQHNQLSYVRSILNEFEVLSELAIRECAQQSAR